MKNKKTLLKDNNIKIHPNVKTVGTVYIEDHSCLIKPKGQRDTVDNPDLSRSIINYGMCTTPTVVEDGNKYIVIDGWHRATHCIKNNTPLLCVIIETEHPIEDIMVALNTTMFNWKPKDFLNFGISFHNNPDYILLDKIYRETGLSLVALYEIFSFNKAFNKRKNLFERGLWKMTTQELGMKTIEYATILKQVAPREFLFSENANFLRGFAVCVKKKSFDFEHLLSQVKRYKTMIHDGDKPRQHAKMINEIYNLNTHEDKQAYLA